MESPQRWHLWRVATFNGARHSNIRTGEDYATITLHGVGGHGAMPHTTVDPVVVAAHLILALQTLVSREVDPNDMAVVTVGAMHAGTVANVIPDTAELKLTIRARRPEVRALLPRWWQPRVAPDGGGPARPGVTEAK